MKLNTILLSALFPIALQAGVPVELPLPHVPDSLRDPSQRADYVIEHFYDALDFSLPDALDTASVEQNFVNFVSLFPHASSAEVIDKAAAELLRRATPEGKNLLMSTAEKYLYDMESPMTNDEFYMPFLRAVASSNPLYGYQLQQCGMNRPGTQAADFNIVALDGSESSLLKSLGDGSTLLIFYDPDCDQCHEIMARVAKKPDVQSGKVKVIAVALSDDDAMWRSDADNLPVQWLISRPGKDVDIESLYSIRGFPTVLMLDSKGTVIAKNVKIQ